MGSFKAWVNPAIARAPCLLAWSDRRTHSEGEAERAQSSGESERGGRSNQKKRGWEIISCSYVCSLISEPVHKRASEASERREIRRPGNEQDNESRQGWRARDLSSWISILREEDFDDGSYDHQRERERQQLIYPEWQNFAEDKMTKKLIRIDITSDTVCPWCYIGKKYLEKAMDQVKDQYDFEVRWHPFFLNKSAPKEGVSKLDFYKKKFGDVRIAPILDRVSKVFADLGLKFSAGGKTGDTLDSHRLIELAGRQGLDKQNMLIEELFLNYFTQEKYIGDKKVLTKAAEKVGVKGAKEFLDDPNAGLKEVQEEMKTYARGVTGVPHFIIDGHYQLSGAQPPESFLDAFKLAVNHDDPDEDALNTLKLA